ncbi:MAG: ketoacyl-ACP synthase III [Chloroflexi bacterium]|nr:ketoacyl-ACP synthase III [Chloroflexota bacterium]
MPVHIVGWGKYVPERILTNDDLSRMVDTSDEWIVSRTGIRERRVASAEETTASMAVQAARRALEVAGLRPAQVELIIVATMTPDYVFPSTACLVQDALGASHAAAFDIGAGCSGFVYGLSVASNMIRSGAYANALVIGSETMSRVLDWTDRETCVLFGDGAGAVLLQAKDIEGGVLASMLGADGSGSEVLFIPAGGSRLPTSSETVAERLHYVTMKGREVYRFAVHAVPDATRSVLERAGQDVADVDMIIPHQANQRIMDASAKVLGISVDKIYSNLSAYGNTSAASIPIALCEAVERGLIQRDHLIVCVGFGGGLTWAAAAIRWTVRLPSEPISGWEALWYRVQYRYASFRSSMRRLLRAILAWWIKE